MEGLLLVNKARGNSSFSLVRLLRRLTKVKKIGHTGTLDPLATGLMVMLIGKKYTKLSDSFVACDKEYLAEIFLGATTSTLDAEMEPIPFSDKKPQLNEIEAALKLFQGDIWQKAPMFSAKKVAGKKLYELARKGQVVERGSFLVNVSISLISYDYPILKIKVNCSKGTYIRTLADDIGKSLQTGAYLKNLERTRLGKFHLQEAIPQDKIAFDDLSKWLKNADSV